MPSDQAILHSESGAFRQENKTSVYAVLYDKSGVFLMAQKRKEAYYVQAKGGKVKKDGWPLSGGGRYALPGGALDETDIDQGARREFFEETGLKLPPAPDHNQPKTVKFDVNGKVLPLDEGEFAFAAVYFYATEEDVANAWSYISSVTLPNSKEIAGAIERGDIETYSEISAYATRRGMAAWPADNELEWVWCWSFNDKNDWAKIEAMKGDPVIGWYYCVLEYLCFNILAARTERSKQNQADNSGPICPPV